MASIPHLDTTQLKEAYDKMNSDFGELKAQAVKHNAKTILKTTLVYASVVATGIFTAIAAATLIGYAFPLVVGNLLIPKIAIACLSAKIFDKTFCKIMMNKFERNTNALLAKLNEDGRKLVKKGTIRMNYSSINMSINMFDNLRFASKDGLYINDLKLASYNEVEQSFKDKVDKGVRETTIRRERQAEAFRKAQEQQYTGFLSYFSRGKTSA